MPILALLPILHVLFAGGSVMSAFGALSLGQWIGLAGALSDAEPAVVLAIQALHPAFEQLVDDLGTHGPEHAGRSSWRRFQPPTIDGYLPDGSVGQVPNPDYLAS